MKNSQVIRSDGKYEIGLCPALSYPSVFLLVLAFRFSITTFRGFMNFSKLFTVLLIPRQFFLLSSVRSDSVLHNNDLFEKEWLEEVGIFFFSFDKKCNSSLCKKTIPSPYIISSLELKTFVICRKGEQLLSRESVITHQHSHVLLCLWKRMPNILNTLFAIVSAGKLFLLLYQSVWNGSLSLP